MAVTKKAAPLKITVDGQEMHPRDTVFVVYSPQGIPVGTVQGFSVLSDSSKIKMGYRAARAARAYWMNPDAAMEKLNDGYRIEFMTFTRFCADIAAKMQPEG